MRRKSAILAFGPVTVLGIRGWPLPDISGDPCPWPERDVDGWLPWAIIRDDAEWYTGLYSCSRGHAWICGYAMVADPSNNYAYLRSQKVSPYRIVPAKITAPARIELIDWMPLMHGAGAV